MKNSFYLIFLLPFYCLSQNATLLETNLSNDSHPQDFIATDRGFYFTADDPVYGYELFFSDGAPENTQVVVDVFEGERDGYRGNIGLYNNRLLFLGRTDYQYEYNLMITNETNDAAEILVEDMQVSDWIAYNNKIYFSGNHNNSGYELWVTDGTAAGTKLVKNINSNGGSSPTSFTIFKDKIYFVANDEEKGYEIYYTDGTEEGTKILKDIAQDEFFPDGVWIGPLLIYKEHLYFMGKGENNYFQLYKSDGTAENTFELKTINPDGHAAYFLEGAVLEDGLYFKANDGDHGTELWKTDGTEEGTKLVVDIWEGPGSGLSYPTSDKNDLVYFDEKIFMVADDNENGTELWQSDGTEEGTQMFRDLSPGPAGTWYQNFYNTNNQLFFSASIDQVSEWYLYKIDVNDTAPQKIDNAIVPNTSALNFGIVSYADKTFFPSETEKYGVELFELPNNSHESELFLDLNSSYGGMPIGFSEMNGNLYFFGANHLNITNGSPNNLREIKSVKETYYQGQAEKIEFERLQDELFFVGYSEEFGKELWKTDGTETGTSVLKDINPGHDASMYDEYTRDNFIATANKMYFPADDGVHGMELWATSGTEESTVMVKDIIPGSQDSHPRHMVNIGESVYFVSRGNSQVALWKTEGTSNSTVPVVEMPDIRVVRTINDKLVMAADYDNSTNDNHNDLVISDGTAEGTSMIMSFINEFDTRSKFWTQTDDHIYFVQQNNENYRPSIFKTDGTGEGTHLVYDGSSHPVGHMQISWIKACNNMVYFAAEKDGPYSEVELWRINENDEVAKVSVDANNLPGDLEYITCFEDKLFFRDLLRDNELWYHQKGESTTKRVDLKIDGKELQIRDFHIRELTSAGNVLYFTGISDREGKELYSLTYGELSELPEESSLPVENINYDIFDIEVYSESCLGKENGKLKIKATEVGEYIADFKGEQREFTENMSFEDLSPGNYEVCIKFGSDFQYSQCYSFQINEGASIAAEINSENIQASSENNLSVKIMEGSAPFTVKLNNQVLGVYDSNDFELRLPQAGILEIESAKNCEGVLAFEVEAENKIIYFPNPVKDHLNILLPEQTTSNLEFDLYSFSGQLLESFEKTPVKNAIRLNLDHLNPGTYFLKLKGSRKETIKIIKK